MTDKYNQKWVMIFASKGSTNWAITIGQTTYYSVPKLEVGEKWRKHEDFHKQQWKDHSWKFPFLYFWELIRQGYKNNKFEIAARNHEES